MSPPIIVRAEIHPAVGIMRVGNSPEHYLGPETDSARPTSPEVMRDADGKLKRQAVRFRVYGYDADGEVVRELAGPEVAWSVHVANHKAAWYDWVIALDVERAEGTTCPRRNPTVKGPARRALAIDAGRQAIGGSASEVDAVELAGEFQSTRVPLGSIGLDDAGRLVVRPSAGVSASPGDDPIFPDKANPFINADGWYDDVCDGPVDAEVTVDGRRVPCEGAWVVSAPPNYAPDVVSVRTLYDLLYDLYVRAGWMPSPLDAGAEVSFERDIRPLLQRFSRLGWVNAAFAVHYGLEGPYPFADPAFVERLADPSEGSRELRRQVFNQFRVPASPSPTPTEWPWVYGDAMARPARGGNDQQNACVSPTQYALLEAWADGRFVRGEARPTYASLDEVPVAEQPAMLTRVALEDALADAFHPGCEVTWPVRHLSMWAAPFRLRRRPAGVTAPDYGAQLTPASALAADGPLHAQGPGGLTRWMGLPWQADSAFCRSGYDHDYDPYVPTFWPATVPNQVLTEEAYAQVMDASRPVEKRQAAFAERANWVRYLPQLYAGEDRSAWRTSTMNQMVEDFGGMGVVVERTGPSDVPGVPSRVYVESLGPPFVGHAPLVRPVAERHRGPAEAVGKPTAPASANFASHEAAKASPLPVTPSPKGKA